MNKQKILVIDDEKKLLRVIKMNLEDKGYEVATAYNGQEALAKITETDPDLVILDVMMPRIDGWEVLSQIRKNPKTRLLPVIMLTAKTEGISKLFGFDLGADDYVTKPFSIDELAARVSAILRRLQISRERERRESRQPTIPVIGGSRQASLIDQQEIVYADAVHNYSYVHTHEDKYLTRFTLTELEKKLADFFMRTHRSYIVNLHQIDALFSTSTLSYRVLLKDRHRTKLPVSRSKIKPLKSRLNM